MADFLHDRRDFDQLLTLVADERGLDPTLVEKDYWIMHCLWGLQDQGFQFELKGGTSLSKGFGVIHRFSEDIDIRIEPPIGMDVKTGRNQDKPAHVESRRTYYDDLATRIRIPGIVGVERDTEFDDSKMRSAGIRLIYTPRVATLAGIKDGVLLESGFDDTAPNRPITISSWALDLALERGVDVFDNRAIDVSCYAPTHTFVEKLQTISTKYRRLDESRAFPANFLRHYYDVYCLLGIQEVQDYLQSPAYQKRKAQRFRTGDEQVITRNPAFLLSDTEQRKRFAEQYQKTRALYYQGQPDFETLLARIHHYLDVM
ncbi:nucleotidyl transferase AbiEii/AbiGii toxin family protein [Pusillimonas sp. ANT_WB101]|uniref:nucleotidyl transferase AbiEii/AbiGii toxin family protein n=1 Tax=Pusillimonas sp. ANT_WB101 TaxID=2597356 RepID=UPI0011EF4F16|nr:nucleotidyl transferase AbiEii/AbiGii toxin family protein [Pusillimonas sp. ANT_WB101]KAA0892600.1 nucleotidyl transferase AbiEii/AbiGii toxin family protein [Pusillimonas sp. ANT_WB101]